MSTEPRPIKVTNLADEIISSNEKAIQNANNIFLDETDTREIFIDKQLIEAGWECNSSTINYKKNKNYFCLTKKQSN
mgnify:CR=1 FL=1